MLFEIVKLGSNIVFESTTHAQQIDYRKLNQMYMDGYRARVDGKIIGRPENVKTAVQQAIANPKKVESPIASYVAARDTKMAAINQACPEVPRAEVHTAVPAQLEASDTAVADVTAAEEEVQNATQTDLQDTAIDTSAIFGPDDAEDVTPTAFVTGMCTKEADAADSDDTSTVAETASDEYRSIDGEILTSGIRCINDGLCFKNQSSCAKHYGFDSALLSDALKKQGYVKKVDKTFQKF